MAKLVQLKITLTDHFSINTLEKYKYSITPFQEAVGK